MIEKSLGLLFYLKPDRKEKKDEMYIYLRITVDGISKEVSTKRLWITARWNAKTMRAEGVKQDAKTVNALLDALYNKAQNARRQLIEQEIEISAEAIKNIITGIDDRKQILQVFQEHNDRVKTLIPQEYSYGTWDLFERTLKHTQSFIAWKYRKEDLYYYVQQLFSLNKGANVVPMLKDGKAICGQASCWASSVTDGKMLIIKLVNMNSAAKYKTIFMDAKGLSATLTMLTGSPEDVNSLQEILIAPKAGNITVKGNVITFTAAPYSLNVIKVKID